MVAFHYPPCSRGSGVHRTLSFSRHLPGHGWRPLVLSAHARAHEWTNEDQLGQVPADAIVRRAFALDARRHLAVGGRYLKVTALPDRWITWWLGALPAGLRLFRTHRPAVIWSTFPIATAHLIGLTLHRLTRTPWVADFRDPMTEPGFPRDVTTRRFLIRIEASVVRHAARLIFATETARQTYLQRYPTLSADRCLTIANGYEEEDFRGLVEAAEDPAAAGTFRLLHSGLIYPEERDPMPLFRALARLKREGQLANPSLRLELRAPGFEARYASVVDQMGLSDVVYVLPGTTHREALRDCASASGLLLLQGPTCNAQIPAKTYEYLRIGRPILALTPAGSDTAAVLEECGGATRVDPLDEESIYRGVPAFIRSVQIGAHPLPDPASTIRYARHTHAGRLAACFSEVARRVPASTAGPGFLRRQGSSPGRASQPGGRREL